MIRAQGGAGFAAFRNPSPPLARFDPFRAGRFDPAAWAAEGSAKRSLLR
jgi:hypothetical protein